MTELNLQELIEAAVQTEDQSVEQTSQFNDDPIQAGKTVGRFIEYIELGKHKQKDFQGKKKPDAEMVRLTFELLHPTKNMREYEVEGETRKSGQLISVKMSKKLSDKANFKKLFKKMTYGRDSIKHFAQMLGEAFIIEIFHNVTKVDGKDVTYVNIDKDGEYGIGAPVIVDPMTDERKVLDILPPTKPIRLFLWSNPTKATWDSLFIDGTREKKNEDGTTTQVSKNWLQELILSAADYQGSALHNLLGGVADLPVSEPANDSPPWQGQETVKPVPATSGPGQGGFHG